MNSNDPFTLDLTDPVCQGIVHAQDLKDFCYEVAAYTREGYTLDTIRGWCSEGKRRAIKKATLRAARPLR